MPHKKFMKYVSDWLVRRNSHIEEENRRKPIIIDQDEASESVFCFLGEFGYELISWLPYLLYLKNTLGIKLRTVSRKGSRIFYYFSDEHHEAPDRLIGLEWGKTSSYTCLRHQFPDRRLIFPGVEMANHRNIAINGIDWRNRDIHKPLDLTHYSKLDFGFVEKWNPLYADRIAVINNKYYLQWPSKYTQPLNYFDLCSLETLIETLRKKGFGVVYNHFVEKSVNEKTYDLNDDDIINYKDMVFDMRIAYEACSTDEERNLLQIAVYNSAEFVLGPQGGNLYLPAICQKDLYILMRAGIYLDYLELGKVYGVSVDTFYEPRHMVAWLEAKL